MDRNVIKQDELKDGDGPAGGLSRVGLTDGQGGVSSSCSWSAK